MPNKTILEITQGESIGGMGTVTSINGFTKDGRRIIYWTWAHHIDGPLSAEYLADEVRRIILEHYRFGA